MNTPTLPVPWLAGIAPGCWSGCDPALFAAVRAAYESPGRHYHAWSHIEACLGEFAGFAWDRPRAALLALLFHDAVYVAGRGDNEERSAELAHAAMRQWTDADEAERQAVRGMILATAHHHANAGAPADTSRLLDIDLAVLGASRDEYDRYAAGVRAEWTPQVVSPAEFIVGRVRFLQGLLAQARIYSTPSMRSRREAAARDNVAREIAQLQAAAQHR